MKHSFFHWVVVAIASCFLSSCFSTKTSTYTTIETKSIPVSKLSDYTTEYVGKPHNYIVSALGAPDRQTSDGAGGTILIYEKTTITSTSNSNSLATAYNVNFNSNTYTPGSETTTTAVQSANTSYIHLFINTDGICYNVKTNHQKIIKKEEEVERVKEDVVLTKFSKIFLGTMGSLMGILIMLACL